MSVGPVIDNRAWPWNKNSLAIDVVLNMYDADGTHLVTVDADNPAVDRSRLDPDERPRPAPLRVHNYTPNGNRGTYPLTTAFVDNIAPTVSRPAPTPHGGRAAYDGPVAGARSPSRSPA